MLTYTSGTTGRSKGAMNLHGAMVHSSTVFARWWDLDPERDVVLGLAPVFHITGAIAGLGAHIVSGAPLVLLHRFDAEATLDAIQRWRATFVVRGEHGLHRPAIALSNHPDLPHYDVSSLTKTPSGGAPVGEGLGRADPRRDRVAPPRRLRDDRDELSDAPGAAGSEPAGRS